MMEKFSYWGPVTPKLSSQNNEQILSIKIDFKTF